MTESQTSEHEFRGAETLVAERPHDQYGIAMFVRDGTTVAGTSLSEVNNVETLSVHFARPTVTSIYMPLNEILKLQIPLSWIVHDHMY